MTQKPNNPVVQQDRERAAQAYRKIIPNEGGAFTFSESIEVGHEDDHWLVQAFAAHRQATLEEAAKVAECFIHSRPVVSREKLETNLAAGIATAIRNLRTDR